MSISALLDSRLVAIVRLDDLTDAAPLVEALLRAGIRCVEFTLTNSEAPDVVKRIRKQFAAFQTGDALIGLGSIRNLAEAEIAFAADAQFIVTPITDPQVISKCSEQRIPIIAGAYTPTEIHAAWTAGATAVKVFPVRGLGPQYIRDVLAPMPYLKLVPTGGIDTTNASSYLDAGAVAVGIGGQLVDAKLIRQRDWTAISARAVAYVDACKA